MHVYHKCLVFPICSTLFLISRLVCSLFNMIHEQTRNENNLFNMRQHPFEVKIRRMVANIVSHSVDHSCNELSMSKVLICLEEKYR